MQHNALWSKHIIQFFHTLRSASRNLSSGNGEARLLINKQYQQLLRSFLQEPQPNVPEKYLWVRYNNGFWQIGGMW